MKKSLRSILNNGGLFVILLLLTALLLKRNLNLAELQAAVQQADVRWLLFGVLSMFLFSACEALNIRRGLRVLSYRPRFILCFKYAFAGFFFSAITPSASGGQPMQAYYMYQDGIEVSHSALALLFGLASYQAVGLLYAVIGLCTQFRLICNSMGAYLPLIFLGLVFNLALLALILLAMFSPHLSEVVLRGVDKLLRFLRYRKADSFSAKLRSQMDEYHRSAVYLYRNKSLIWKTLLTTAVQLLAMHGISYLIYRSLHLSEFSYLAVVGMQAVLYISVSALPLPGAVGVSEGGFLLLFRQLFPPQLLSGALLLSRGISFYLFVLITGLSLGCSSLWRLCGHHPAPVCRQQGEEE